MVCGFCAVSQSCSSSRVSTDASTDTGISTIPLGMQSDYQLTLEKQTLLAHALPTLVVRRQWSRSPPKATLLGNFFELRTEHIDVSAVQVSTKCDMKPVALLAFDDEVARREICRLGFVSSRLRNHVDHQVPGARLSDFREGARARRSETFTRLRLRSAYRSLAR